MRGGCRPLRLAATFVIVDEMSMGVREFEVRKSVSDFGTRRVPVRKAGARGMTERGRCIESVMIAFYRHTGLDGLREAKVLAFIMSIEDLLCPSVWPTWRVTARFHRM